MAINDMPTDPSMAILWRIYLHLIEINPQEKIPQPRGISLSDIRRIMVAEHFTKRLDWIIHTINRELTVEQAFPCAMKRDARYELRIKRNDGRFFLILFTGRYAAKKFIDTVINGREVLDLSYETILAGEEVRISSKKLRAILNHEYTPDEAQWQLPLPYSYYAHVAATGDMNYRGDASSRKRDNTPSEAPTRSKAARKRASSPASSTEASAVQPKRAFSKGRTTFGPSELASHLGIPAGKIRATLRAKLTKPASGWEWPTSEFEEILKKIR